MKHRLTGTGAVRLRRYALVLLLSLPLTWFVGHHLNLAHHLNGMLWDHLIFQAWPTLEPAPVVVIGIDDASLEAFPTPLMLWHEYFAAVIAAASHVEAQAVGFDLIHAIALDDLAPELDAALVRALLQARRAGIPVILGYSTGTGGLLPHPKFRFAASDLGFLDLAPDTDGVLRHYTTHLHQPETPVLSALGWALLPARQAALWQHHPATIPIAYHAPLPPTLSLASVYQRWHDQDHAWLHEHLSGRVILVGATSPALRDRHTVPAPGPNHQRLDGVYIHALALHSLWAGPSLKPLSDGVLFGAILAVAIFVALLSIGLAPLRATLAITALLPVGYLGIYLAFTQGVWIPAAPLLAALLISSASMAVLRYHYEYRQFRRLQRYFSRYVHADIMREILQHPEHLNLTGKQVDVTVMFTDIRGFTTLAEHLPPSQVVAGLNEYFAAMTQTVTATGGYLNRYLGDGILAIFGAPVPLPHRGALAAVHCALQMRTQLDKLNQRNLFPGTGPLRIGIGIHTGPALVGTIGCFEKMEYSIIGDTVNLAARVEQKTKDLDVMVLLTESSYTEIKEYVKIRAIGRTLIKGREQAVTLYELLDVTAPPHSSQLT